MTVIKRHRLAAAAVAAIFALSFGSWLVWSAGAGEPVPPGIAVSSPGGGSGPAAEPPSAAAATQTPTADAGSPTSTPTPAVSVETPEQALAGFVIPVEGACLPASERLFPGASREYRGGIHEGTDFYPGESRVDIRRGTPVLAAKAGVVVRSDHTYVELDTATRDSLLQQIVANGGVDRNVLDRLRGRQVWIQHPDGTTTVYAHLQAVAEGLQEGASVGAGDVVGSVGNSGTSGGAAGSDDELHLHFEIRWGPETLALSSGLQEPIHYAGEGMEPEAIRALLRAAFGLPAGSDCPA